MALKEVLRRNRLQQKAVAEGLGVSRQTVCFWVSGHVVPGGENLSRLLDFLRQFEPSLEVSDLMRAA